LEVNNDNNQKKGQPPLIFAIIFCEKLAKNNEIRGRLMLTPA
jgi:hypothetical protein